jgi:hypothetical protein
MSYGCTWKSQQLSRLRSRVQYILGTFLMQKTAFTDDMTTIANAPFWTMSGINHGHSKGCRITAGIQVNSSVSTSTLFFITANRLDSQSLPLMPPRNT